MKVVQVYIILSFCLLSIICQSATVVSSCPNNNPYIIQLTQTSLYNSPKFGVNKCGDEWKTYGTCCNEYQLPSEAKNDQTRIETAVSVINDQIKQFNGALESLFTHIKRYASFPPTQWDTNVNNNIIKVKQILDRPSTIAFFQEFTSIDKIDAASFAAENNKCWSLISRARSSSLCSTCSGRSEVYFLDNKALISEAFCHRLMGECKSSFENLVQFVKAISFMNSIYKELSPVGIQINSDAKVRMSLAQEYWRVISEDGIPNLFKTYSPSSAPEVTVSLCNKFIQLRKQTFIEDVLSLISNRHENWRVNFWGNIQQHYESNKQQVDEAVSKWEAAHKNVVSNASSNWGRRLSRASLSGKIGPEAAKILTTDVNIGSSYDITGSSTVDAQFNLVH